MKKTWIHEVEIKVIGNHDPNTVARATAEALREISEKVPKPTPRPWRPSDTLWSWGIARGAKIWPDAYTIMCVAHVLERIENLFCSRRSVLTGEAING